jgi:hypothetical protein
VGRAVGEERGGVTGALLEIRSAGRLGRFRRKGRRYDGLTAAVLLKLGLGLGFSLRVGLGNEDDEGLAW